MIRLTAPSDQASAGPGDLAAERQHAFRDVLLVLRRYRWLIATAALVGLAFGVAALMLLTPSYTAAASLVLDPRRPRVTDLPSVISDQMPLDITPQLRTELQVLESDGLCRRVIQQLGLLEQPDVDLGGRQSIRWFGTILDWLRDHVSWLALARRNDEDKADAQSADPNILLARAVAAYKSHFAVNTDGHSYVIELRFTSHDPRLAAQVLNTHIDLYLADQVAYKRQVGKQASEWLAAEIPKLQARLKTSQGIAERFREENNIIRAGNTTLLSQQLAAVNAEIPAAVQEHVNREARLQEARKLLRRGTVDTEPEITGSQTIGRLREQEATLLRKQGELSTTYGPQHPALVKLRSELDDLQRAIAAEAQRITKGLENDVAVAASRENELRQRLADLERQSVVAQRAEAKLSDLESEVAANRSLLDQLSTRYKQVAAQEGAQVADARVIASALVPVGPSFPRPFVVLPLSLSLGTLAGMALAFYRELVLPGFQGSQQVEAEFSLPSLGSLPIVPREGMLQRPEDAVIERPRSAFSEAVRYIRYSIQTVRLDIEAPRTVLITSSLPNEGKSVLAVSLARSYARAGKRTLLIDCDLRNPSVGRLLGVPNPEEDLVTLLSDGAPLHDVIQQDPKSGLEFIPAQTPQMEPQDVLSSEKASQLLQCCAQAYDMVIVDSPPITAVSDALILARHADATILAVRWGRTHREIARTSLNRLFVNGARLCGAVLTQVDMRRGVFSPHEPEYYQKQKLNRVYYHG